MARIRTVKPEYFTSEQVANCHPMARYLFIGMWCFCDDQGIHPASSKQIKMEIFPADDLTDNQITEWINDLIRNDLISEYEVVGKKYWIVTGWKHQKIDKPNSRHPYPEPSQIIRRKVVEHLPEESKGREGKGEEGKRKKDFDHRLRADRPANDFFPDQPSISPLKINGHSDPDQSEFAAVWALWPRKVAKAAAAKAWLKARKKADFKEIMAGIEAFVLAYDADPRPETEKQQFCSHFASWLNGERWGDYAQDPDIPPDRSAMTPAERTREILLEAGLTPLI